MRYRVLAVVAAALALSVVVATATASRNKASSAQTLTVWLQVDAQNGWPEVVAAANNAFENSHPGWNVNVQYQQWSDHLQKFDATIAGNTTPDVIEMGNTEMTKYMAAGAFTNISSAKGQFANSKNWLSGLKASSTFDGKLFGVPYYAGSR
jgi:N,N'-diacetylchitobiose transport system substrate-binding protein